MVAISGDMSRERLGLEDETYERLQQETDLVINCAAIVSFDAPLDEALELNALGPSRIMEFARGCHDAILVHVSTCYVNGTRQGPIAEEPIDHQLIMTTHNGAKPLAWDVEQDVADIRRLTERVHKRSFSPLRQPAFAFKAWLRRLGKSSAFLDATPPVRERLRRDWVEQRLVTEGMRRAQRKGFNDTYTLTKAMGEQLLIQHRGDVPILILRPSIVESALESPAPGWLDGMRMLDPLILAYGRNLLPDFPGRGDSILDIIPVDMVVNALLAAVPKTDFRNGPVVCQVASGMENPISPKIFADLVQDYFRQESQNINGAYNPEIDALHLSTISNPDMEVEVVVSVALEDCQVLSFAGNYYSVEYRKFKRICKL